MSFQRNKSAVSRFGRLMKLGAWLQKLPNKLTPPPFRLMQIGSAFWHSRALYVAARLDIATALGNDTVNADEIAARVNANPDATHRLLRLLAAIGIFEEVGPQSYRNNSLSAFLRTDHPQNVRAMILMHNSETMSRPWYEQLERGVREDIPPFRLAYNEELFAYLDRHPDFDALFSRAMDSVEALTGDSFATDFDWSRFERIIDIGGSRGTKSLAILKRYPRLTALVVDRPQVVSEAEQYRAGQSTSGLDRLRFQAGNFLNSVLPAQSDKDIYLLSAVLHGFDNTTCVTVLNNLARAIGTTGARAALLEVILPETGADVAATSFDMQMFMATSGRERTLAEWKSLTAGGGLTLEEVVALRSIGSILVLRRT